MLDGNQPVWHMAGAWKYKHLADNRLLSFVAYTASMAKDLQSTLDKALKDIPSQGELLAAKVWAHPYCEHHTEIMKQLKTRPTRDLPHRLHIGAAGFMNFEIAAQTKPDAMLLLDINTCHEEFWQQIARLLITCETPDKFRQVMHTWLSTSSSKDVEVLSPDAVDHYLQTEANWLEDPQAYAHLRRLALEGKIVTASIDLMADHQRAHALGEWIKQHKFNVDTCYWSNVGYFVQPHDNRLRYVHTEQSVFPDFPDTLYYKEPEIRSDNGEPKFWSKPGNTWNGGETEFGGRMLKQRERFVTSDELPSFEKLLCNISIIGGETGTHMMTANRDRATPISPQGNLRPLIVIDGPPRNLQRIARQREQAASRLGVPNI